MAVFPKTMAEYRQQSPHCVRFSTVGIAAPAPSK
jgi:hypothetical protein